MISKKKIFVFVAFVLMMFYMMTYAGGNELATQFDDNNGETPIVNTPNPLADPAPELGAFAPPVVGAPAAAPFAPPAEPEEDLVCEEGFEAIDGECIEIELPEEDLICEEGFDAIDGECVEISPIEEDLVCEEGFEAIDSECVEIESTEIEEEDLICEEGFDAIDGVCVESKEPEVPEAVVITSTSVELAPGNSLNFQNDNNTRNVTFTVTYVKSDGSVGAMTDTKEIKGQEGKVYTFVYDGFTVTIKVDGNNMGSISVK